MSYLTSPEHPKAGGCYTKSMFPPHGDRHPYKYDAMFACLNLYESSREWDSCSGHAITTYGGPINTHKAWAIRLSAQYPRHLFLSLPCPT